MQQGWRGEPPAPRMASAEAPLKRHPTPTPKKRRQSFVAPIPPGRRGVRPPQIPGAELVPGGSSGLRPPVATPPYSTSLSLYNAGLSAPLHYNTNISTISEPPFGNVAAWDTRSSTSTPTLDKQAAGDVWSPTRTPHFDLTHDQEINLNDPMSSTQSFTGMLTQEFETPVDALTQESGKGRGGNYSRDEDIQLCWSWMDITYDAITANGQPRPTYWNRIAEHYHENKTFDSERNATSLEKRWGIIQKECLKFQACFEGIERLRPSGVPFTEHKSFSGAKGCLFVHCWTEVRHSEKFMSVHEAMKKQQGKRQSQSATTSQQDEPAPIAERPPGQKQAKQKLKKKDGEDEYVEVLSSFMQMKTEEQKKREERWKVDKELEERKVSIEERRLQWDLQNKSNRELEERKLSIEERRLQWEQEQQIMFCDVSNMDESQKAYVLAMREEIAREKVASLKSSRGAATSCASEHGSV